MSQTRPSVFVNSNEEGVERVQKEKGLYAFFMESTSIEYQVERKCDLQQVGGLLDSKGYGIGMPVSKYTQGVPRCSAAHRYITVLLYRVFYRRLAVPHDGEWRSAEASGERSASGVEVKMVEGATGRCVMLRGGWRPY